MRKIILLGLTLCAILSCKEEKPEGIYESGKIEYSITYLNSVEGNYDPAILPKKMVLSFNQDYSVNSIEGFMGVFKLSNITYFDSSKSNTYLKIFQKHYLYSGEKNEMMCCFDCMSGMKIKYDTASINLAGLKSHKASIRIPSTGEEFDAYYTYDIKLKDPNKTNPYKKIAGVLTDFRLAMGPYQMKFTANKFTHSNTDQKKWKSPKEAQIVNREQMSFVLAKIMHDK